jgi:hypothetical protein
MSTREKMVSHYKNIKEKHDILDKKIQEAYNHYTKDEDIHKMKQEKLVLKEEMFRIEKELGTEDGKRIPGRY